MFYPIKKGSPQVGGSELKRIIVYTSHLIFCSYPSCICRVCIQLSITILSVLIIAANLLILSLNKKESYTSIQVSS